jgi:hypothetical protein
MIMLISTAGAFAQGTGKYRLQTSLGLLAGANYSTMTGKDFVGQRLENKPIAGYHFGANVQIPFLEVVYLQPGIHFSTRGAIEPTPDPEDDRVRITYLEVPLHVVYKNRLPAGFFYFGLGPYAGYAMQGLILTSSGGNHRKTEIEFKDVVEPEDQVVAPYLRRLDAGVAFLIGYELFEGLSFQFNAQLGLKKINPEFSMFPDDKRELRNAGVGLTLGFRW